VEEGQRVRVPRWDREGVVVEVDGDQVLVALGSMKIELPLSDLYPSREQQTGAVKTLVPARKRQTVPAEIQLLGNRVDEALAELDKYLDDAALAGLDHVRIVHGKGTGALRQAIHTFLRSHPAIADFALAPHEEGGEGVTLANLQG
jgi:DNA mismatch repair protein MutS2